MTEATLQAQGRGKKWIKFFRKFSVATKKRASLGLLTYIEIQTTQETCRQLLQSLQALNLNLLGAEQKKTRSTVHKKTFAKKIKTNGNSTCNLHKITLVWIALKYPHYSVMKDFCNGVVKTVTTKGRHIKYREALSCIPVITFQPPHQCSNAVLRHDVPNTPNLCTNS